jgi:hypothetical protein
MNERIKELMIEAGFFPTELTQVGPSVEKFAELIIRECAEVCYGHSRAAGGIDTHFGYGYKDCGDDIKRNFGVEL